MLELKRNLNPPHDLKSHSKIILYSKSLVPQITKEYNDIDEARFIVERSQQWIDGGGGPDEIAVLYRSNAQSRVIEEALLRANIPYRIYGGQRFFERAEVKNALAYMRSVSYTHLTLPTNREV